MMDAVRTSLSCVIVAVVALGLASSCADAPPARCTGAGCPDTGGADADQAGDECELDRDCSGEYTCENGYCSAPGVECFDREDCEGEEAFCDSDGLCQTPPGSEDAGMDASSDGETDAGADGGTDDAGPGGDVDDAGDRMDGGPDGGQCEGCYFSDGEQSDTQCVEGTDDGACGSGGEECVECGEGETCSDQGECVEESCSPNNCDGCCRDGTCETGTSDSACGSEGEECSSCQNEARCLEADSGAGGSCESCNGCWTSGDVCESGGSDDACGSGGESCSSCGSGETCDNGTCVEESQSCTDSCSGCCSGGSCELGTSDSACGSGGSYCRSCQDGYSCQGGSCELDHDSRWDIIAVSATIPDRSSNGTYWDPGTSSQAADPYIEVTVDGLSQTHTAQTDYEEDTHSPYWYETTVEDVRAGDILSDTTYLMRDWDPWYRGGDDLIVDNCTADFDENDFDSLTWSVDFDCVNNSGSSNPTETTVELRLVPH